MENDKLKFISELLGNEKLSILERKKVVELFAIEFMRNKSRNSDIKKSSFSEKTDKINIVDLILEQGLETAMRNYNPI